MRYFKTWLASIRLSSVAIALVIGAVGGWALWRVTRSLPSSAPRLADAACSRAYTELFRGPVLRAQVVFGYKDARPARFVGDRYERMLFVQRVTAPCPVDAPVGACGFARAPQDADLFMRLVPGPDGAVRRVELRIAHASVSPDDEVNRADPFQQWQSDYAERVWTAGLSQADIVFYNGHSRGGGGPDFSPPRLLGGAVDLARYRKRQEGIDRLLASLHDEQARVQVLGMYSCASSTHFESRLRRVRPRMGLIASPRLLYFSDALESSLESLRSLLAMRCENGFHQALRKPEIRASGARISGFFDRT